MGAEPSGLIQKLLELWFPGHDLPRYSGGWLKMCCPFHDETRPSSSVNYDKDAFVCRACDWKGDAISLIKRKEGMGYSDALKFAERVLDKRYDKIQEQSSRKPGRIVFGEARAPRTGTRQVPPWLC